MKKKRKDRIEEREENLIMSKKGRKKEKWRKKARKRQMEQRRGWARKRMNGKIKRQ